MNGECRILPMPFLITFGQIFEFVSICLREMKDKGCLRQHISFNYVGCLGKASSFALSTNGTNIRRCFCIILEFLNVTCTRTTSGFPETKLCGVFEKERNGALFSKNLNVFFFSGTFLLLTVICAATAEKINNIMGTLFLGSFLILQMTTSYM